jgi:nicotinamidase-related amidase
MRSGLPALLPLNAALIVIDLQRAIDHPSWGIRNNPQAEANVARLLSHWRATRRPIYHIRHDSREPASHYRPGQAGNEFKPEATPLPGELVLAKHTANAFASTDLEQRLRHEQQTILLFTGVITNNSVEATVRMAGDLGFETFLIEDGVFTFGRKDWTAVYRTAEEVHAMSLANLDQEYCRIVSTRDVLIAAGEGRHPTA